MPHTIKSPVCLPQIPQIDAENTKASASIWGKLYLHLARAYPFQLSALPLPRQKNLLKLAFSALGYRRGKEFISSQNSLYIVDNQLYKIIKNQCLAPFSGLDHAATDFEFNKPILKKGLPILNYFEGFLKKLGRFTRILNGFRKKMASVFPSSVVSRPPSKISLNFSLNFGLSVLSLRLFSPKVNLQAEIMQAGRREISYSGQRKRAVVNSKIAGSGSPVSGVRGCAEQFYYLNTQQDTQYSLLKTK